MSTKQIAEVQTRRIASVNPTTGELLREYEADSRKAIDSKLDLAIETFQRYRTTDFAARARFLSRAAEVLEAEKNILAEMMTREMGKPLRAAIQEVEKCAACCRYYAQNGAGFLADEEAQTNAARSYVRYQPLGPVLAVMPWNFPFWQVFRFAVPALMAGNVGLLKHASNVPQCALAIEGVFRSAGFPDGAFQTLLVGSDAVSAVIEDPRIRAVTLTGSVEAGRKVAEAAGRQLKKTVLELGGSDPFIVMPSADLESAVATAVQARIVNNGQSCIAAKRFIVAEAIADRFEKQFVERMAALKVGDPMDPVTDVGPLATAGVLQDLEEQVNRTVEMGARVLCGGKRIKGKGNFFAPTVLADIPEGSPAHADELFGPVASVFRVRDMAGAIRAANDSQFGLGASAWTNDQREREMFINEIEAGLAFVNGMVASDSRIPFGGVKNSGYGRELGAHGIREFVNVKSVSIYERQENRSRTE